MDSVKYLGVRMGNVTPDSAFAFPLGEAQRRAGSIAAYGLSMKKHILLLKTWILPCVLLTARAYFATKITVRALKHVYHTALGVDSWGVTLDNLAQPREPGGFLAPHAKGLAPCTVWTALSQALANTRGIHQETGHRILQLV